LISIFSKDKIVYDPNIERWFYCNVFNVWKEYKDPIITKAIVPTIIHSLFERRNSHYVSIICKVGLIINIDDPWLSGYGIKKDESMVHFTARLNLSLELCGKIMNLLKGTELSKKIIHHSHLCIKDKFKEDYL